MNQRLSRVTTALSAKERALLVLRAVKERRHEDLGWRLTMPAGQVREFNRYIGLINGANIHLGYLITVLMKEAEKLELRLCWLFSLKMWELNLAEISFNASVVVREPITDSTHRVLAQQTAAEYVPIGQLASLLAERRRAWSDDDLADLGSSGQLVVKDKAWARLCAEAEQELRREAAAGRLETRGKGKALRVRSGSYDAWLGQPATAYPAWAGGYEVRPDSEASSVEADLATLKHLSQFLEKASLDRLLEGPAESDTTVTGLSEVLQRGLWQSAASQWAELRAAEIVIDDVTQEFNGEDVLKAVHRLDLDQTKQKLESIARYLEACGEAPPLAEPDEQEVIGTRDLLEMGVRLFA